ncbi:MAG: FeoC-like transcriptional regulator [Nocardioidaceae bacterium]
MILTDLQHHLRSEGRASLAQLSLRFGVEPEALRGMLGRLVAKQRVRALPRPARCAGCKICPDTALELYEWAAAPSAGRALTCGGDLAPPEVRHHCRCGTFTTAARRSADGPRGAGGETVCLARNP